MTRNRDQQIYRDHDAPRRPPKVLQVYSARYPAIRGGVDTTIMCLIDGLQRQHEVALFTAGSWEDRTLSISRHGQLTAACMRLRDPLFAPTSLRAFLAWLIEVPRTLLRLWRFICRERIDIIHLHTLQRYQLYFALLRKVRGPPYVVTLHGSEVRRYRDRDWLTRLIWNLVLRNASVVTAVSGWLADEARKTLPFLQHIVTIRNGVDARLATSLLRRSEVEARLGYSLPDRFFTILGALEGVKAQDTAIRAWPRVLANDTDLHLLLIGDGNLRSAYAELARQLSCSEHVHFLGHLPRDLALSIAARGVGMVIPSRFEGIGFMLLEAGILGLPVICTDIGAFGEVAANGISAIVVPVNDPPALAKAVASIVNDPTLRYCLGNNLGRVVTSNFSSDRMVTEYAKAYGIALSEPRSKRSTWEV